VGSAGVGIILFTIIVRLILAPLLITQLRSSRAMQRVQPLVAELRQKHGKDRQALNQATLALYKEHNVNPFASCLPLVVQMPILFSVFYAVKNNLHAYQTQHWLWINPAASALSPRLSGAPFFGVSLAHTDVLLLVLYVASMYFSVRYSSMPSTDPQQAQTQKMMAIISPAMIAYLGFRYQWPSALILFLFLIHI